MILQIQKYFELFVLKMIIVMLANGTLSVVEVLFER